MGWRAVSQREEWKDHSQVSVLSNRKKSYKNVAIGKHSFGGEMESLVFDQSEMPVRHPVGPAKEAVSR